MAKDYITWQYVTKEHYIVVDEEWQAQHIVNACTDKSYGEVRCIRDKYTNKWIVAQLFRIIKLAEPTRRNEQ